MGNEISNLFSSLKGSDFISPYAPSVSYNLLAGSLLSDITFTRAGTTATYFNSSGILTSAGANVARFDYDPATLALKGLLIERAGTNLIANQFQTIASWPNTGTTTTANAGTAPDGTNTLVSITDTVAAGNHLIGGYNIGGVTNGVPYTYSAFLKQGTLRYAALYMSVAAGSIYTAVIDLQTGIVTTTNSVGTPSNPSNSVQALGNGFYRLSVTSTAVGTPSGFMAVCLSDSATPTFASGIPQYTGTGKNIFIWGGQAEASPYATSYIPTSGATATRNQDFATVTSIPWFNALNGSFTSEFIYEGLDSGGTVGPVVFDTDINNRIGIGSTVANHPNGYIVNGGVVGTITDTYSTWPVGSVIKEGLTYKASANVMAVNGVTNSTSTFASSGIPPVTTLRFGRDASASGAAGNCMWLRNFNYYNYPLPTSQIQNKTT